MLAAAALADAFGLEVLFHADQLYRDVLASVAQLIDTGLDHGETFAGIVDLIDLGVQVGDLGLHLFGHCFGLPLFPDIVRCCSLSSVVFAYRCRLSLPALVALSTPLS